MLAIIEGPDAGTQFDLPGDEPQLIGRSSEALPLSDNTVSRRHAELTPDGLDWYIRDLSSQNGTFVNGVGVDAPALAAFQRGLGAAVLAGLARRDHEQERPELLARAEIGEASVAHARAHRVERAERGVLTVVGRAHTGWQPAARRVPRREVHEQRARGRCARRGLLAHQAPAVDRSRTVDRRQLEPGERGAQGRPVRGLERDGVGGRRRFRGPDLGRPTCGRHGCGRHGRWARTVGSESLRNPDARGRVTWHMHHTSLP